MRRSKKQEIVSRILVSSSVFILGSPIFTQALFSIPASAASISTTAATEEKKAALAYNILWSGMWGTAPATLDIEGVLTVGEGTLTTTVDQVIPIAEVSSNMTIRKVVLTAPVVLPADVPALKSSIATSVIRL